MLFNRLKFIWAKVLFGAVVYCAHTSSSSFLSISFRSLPNSVFRARYKLSSRGAYFSTAALNVPSRSLFVIRKNSSQIYKMQEKTNMYRGILGKLGKCLTCKKCSIAIITFKSIYRPSYLIFKEQSGPSIFQLCHHGLFVDNLLSPQ